MRRPDVHVAVGALRLAQRDDGGIFEPAFRAALTRLLDDPALAGAAGRLRLDAVRVVVAAEASPAEAAAQAARAVVDAALAALGRAADPLR